MEASEPVAHRRLVGREIQVHDAEPRSHDGPGAAAVAPSLGAAGGLPGCDVEPPVL